MRGRAHGQLASALAGPQIALGQGLRLQLINSALLIVPLPSSALADAICSAGLVLPATD